MPEIGATLREARMRARIDISEIEAETKIRAKYLRALENEEWDLLPGTTYVKSFLRTYAEVLGLDAKLLVEEYKLRHERLSDVELQPIAPPTARHRARPVGVGVPRGLLVGGILVALVVALALLGRDAGDDPAPSARETQTTTGTTTRTTPRRRPATSPAAPRSRIVSLQLIPTGPVYVCLDAAGDRRLIDGEILNPSPARRRFRSSRFRMVFGNGAIEMRVNGRAVSVPEVRAGIGYEVTAGGRRSLPRAQWPGCR
jgi:hypothetical protein